MAVAFLLHAVADLFIYCERDTKPLPCLQTFLPDAHFHCNIFLHQREDIWLVEQALYPVLHTELWSRMLFLFLLHGVWILNGITEGKQSRIGSVTVHRKTPSSFGGGGKKERNISKKACNRTADIFSDRCVQLNNQSKRIEKILKTNNFFQLTKRFII